MSLPCTKSPMPFQPFSKPSGAGSRSEAWTSAGARAGRRSGGGEPSRRCSGAASLHAADDRNALGLEHRRRTAKEKEALSKTPQQGCHCFVCGSGERQGIKGCTNSGRPAAIHPKELGHHRRAESRPRVGKPSPLPAAAVIPRCHAVPPRKRNLGAWMGPEPR